MNKNVVIIGAGGHAKVIADIIDKSKDIVVGFLDDNKTKGDIIIKEKQYKVMGRIDECKKIQLEYPEIEFIIAIGNNKVRKQIAERYKDLKFYTAIHPSSQIALDVEIGEGTVVMANASINTSAKIKKHCIINTGAVVEHDNCLENYVHISPNATLCGTVQIGELTHIGAGTTIRNNISICHDCIIGAGSVVVKNINEPSTYIGIPAREMIKSEVKR